MAKPGGYNPGRKTTAAIQHQRLEEIIEKLLSAWQRFEIVNHYMREWGVSERRVDKMIAKATKIIRDNSESFDDLMKDRIALGMSVMRKALEKGDLKTAATFYTALNRLGGMERTSIDVTSNGRELQPAQIVFELPGGANALAPALALPESAKQLTGLQADEAELSSPQWTVETLKVEKGPENEPTSEDGEQS